MSLIHQLLLGDETCDPFLSTMNKCPVLSTPTDWKETDDAHMFISELPGMKKEEVKVEVDEGRVLHISGERKSHEDEDDKNKNNNNKWHHIERFHGKFQRRFKLPENAKVDQVRASMGNGVLVVTIPKQEMKKPQIKVIPIEGN